MKLKELKSNPNNPRFIKDDKFEKLVDSIIKFPKMMLLRPIIHDKDKVNLGGNMRQKAIEAIKERGKDAVIQILTQNEKYENIAILEPVFKGVFPDGWTKCADNLTEEEKKEFIIKDNASFGSWDMDLLANEWDVDLLNDWGLDLDFPIDDKNEEEEAPGIDNAVVILNVEFKDVELMTELYNELINRGFKCSTKGVKNSK